MSGCAAITGMPEPLKTPEEVTAAKVCPSDDQLTKYYGPLPSGFSSKADYRNYVIAGCVNAIDAKYADFKAKLQRTAVSANLVTDILVLGLSGAASLTTGTGAQQLAAGATVVTGTGAAIDKDIFYQQTLPAVLSSMEANRATALKTIVDQEKADAAGTSYGLANAVSDLNAYEAAGNIYKAISDLTKSANTTAQGAQAQLTASELGRPSTAVAAPVFAREKVITDKIWAMIDPPDRPKLVKLAGALGITPTPSESFDDIRVDVLDTIHGRISAPGADQTKAVTDIETAYSNSTQ